MKSLLYVEIDIDYCSLTYGVPPCMAQLGVTGEHKCFNTLSTCQDRAHYTRQTVTLRFAQSTDYLPAEIDCIPNINGYSVTPATVSLGRDLGQRGSLSVTFGDHPHSDTGRGMDKYWNERDYDPYTQGSFWGKFRARQPYLRGHAIRLIMGTLGQSLEEMETQHFVIESFNGPTREGTYTITAKDLLKFADGDRAQAPYLNNGYIASPVGPGDTVVPLGPAGIGDLEYPASGWVAIGGKEICSFTRSGNTLTLVRGQHGTEPQDHDSQDRVQLCLYYQAMDPADIVYDLLVNYAKLDPADIPLLDWKAETQSFLRRVYSAIIAEPTPVAKLINELIEQAALAVWWDAIGKKVRLQVLRQIDSTAELFTPENVREGTLTSVEQPDKRVSQVWTYFGKINPLEGQDDANNYRSVALSVDLEGQTNYGTPAIKKIFSRWIPAFGRLVAVRVNDIQLGRFRIPPRRIQLGLQRFNMDAVLGGAYRVQGWHMQDALGRPEVVPIQVTRINRKQDVIEVEAEELRFVSFDVQDPDNRSLIIDSDTPNVNVRQAYSMLYPPPVAGDLVEVFIERGITVYATRANVAAFDIGDWPPGVDIRVYLRGHIRGAGGDGGRGWEPGRGPTAGQDGGTAIFTRYPFRLEIQEAGSMIAGGGGGGGGSNVNTFGEDDDRGGGGGGGAGYRPGNGGAATAPGQPGRPGTRDAGGTYGLAWSTKNWYDFNYYVDAIRGGGGGNLTTAGGGGTGWGGSSGAPGGRAGYAIDGRSFINIVGNGDRRGPEVN